MAGTNDSQIQWSVSPQGGNASIYTPAGGSPDNTGGQCEVYGITPGDVLIQAAIDGIPVISVRADVVNNINIPYRVNLLSSGLATRSAASTVAQLQDDMTVANIILRQAGITLVPDQDPTPQTFFATTVSAVAGTPGFFDVYNVPPQYVDIAAQGALTQVGAQMAQASEFNYRAGVVNFNIVGSLPTSVIPFGPTVTTYGFCPTAPPNTSSNPFSALNEFSMNSTMTLRSTPENNPIGGTNILATVIADDATHGQTSGFVGSVMVHGVARARTPSPWER